MRRPPGTGLHDRSPGRDREDRNPGRAAGEGRPGDPAGRDHSKRRTLRRVTEESPVVGWDIEDGPIPVRVTKEGWDPKTGRP